LPAALPKASLDWLKADLVIASYRFIDTDKSRLRPGALDDFFHNGIHISFVVSTTVVPAIYLINPNQENLAAKHRKGKLLAPPRSGATRFDPSPAVLRTTPDTRFVFRAKVQKTENVRSLRHDPKLQTAYPSTKSLVPVSPCFDASCGVFAGPESRIRILVAHGNWVALFNQMHIRIRFFGWFTHGSSPISLSQLRRWSRHARFL
jgi:hypothetical protein